MQLFGSIRETTVTTFAEPTRRFGILRLGLVGLSALTTVGIAGDLAVERHWREPAQLIPWAAIVLLAGASVSLFSAPGRGASTLRAQPPWW